MDNTITRAEYIQWIQAYARVIAENKTLLTDLDSAIGDADHGISMDRGFQAVLAKLPGFMDQDIGAISKNIAMILISTVGGASGPLYGTLFLQFSMKTAGKMALSLQEWTDAFDAGVDGIIRRGKASPGDKTMLDCLLPALDAFKTGAQAGATLDETFRAAEKAAHEGMLATIPMVAKKGRASYLGERSAGTQDPGATSSHLLLATAVETWFGSA